MADGTEKQRVAEDGPLGGESSWGAPAPVKPTRRRSAAASRGSHEPLQFVWRPGASDFPEALGAPTASKPLPKTGENPYAAQAPFEFPFPIHATPTRKPIKVIPPIFAVLVIVGAFLSRDRWLPGSSGDGNEAVATATVGSPAATATGAHSLMTQSPGAATPSAATTAVSTPIHPTPGATTTGTTGSPSTGFKPGLVEAAEGDTLIAIADAIGLSVSTLVWANDIGDPGAPLEAGTLVVVPPADGVLHTVQNGETLASIAAIYGVDPSVITGVEENGVATDADLKPGIVLFIPGATLPSRADVATYTVREGDNLWGIADYYGLNPFTLAWANGLVEPFVIQVGDQLTIPPADGIYIVTAEGDTVESLAATYGVDPALIREFPFNKMQDPFAEPAVGQPLMIPSLDALVNAWEVGPPTDEAEPTPVG